MIRTTVVLSILTASLLSVSALAQQETWKCTFKGSVTHTDLNPVVKEDLEGEMSWVGSGKTWKITGKTSTATIAGTCEEPKCTIEEKVNSGPFAGSVAYWDGTYTTESASETQTTETMTGTWGHSSNDRKNGGTWEGKATCTK